jgi:hypothetical protein
MSAARAERRRSGNYDFTIKTVIRIIFISIRTQLRSAPHEQRSGRRGPVDSLRWGSRMQRRLFLKYGVYSAGTLATLPLLHACGGGSSESITPGNRYAQANLAASSASYNALSTFPEMIDAWAGRSVLPVPADISGSPPAATATSSSVTSAASRRLRIPH